MKSSILFIATLCLLLMSNNSLKAQEFNPEKNNYLILSKNIRQLEPVLLTAAELSTADGDDYGEFYVVLCGKTVTDIPDNPEFVRLLKRAEALNVRIFVCGISLAKFKIDANQVPTGATVIENGILYGLQLSKLGFIALTI